jgi:hypothetical protein
VRATVAALVAAPAPDICRPDVAAAASRLHDPDPRDGAEISQAFVADAAGAKGHKLRNVALRAARVAMLTFAQDVLLDKVGIDGTARRVVDAGFALLSEAAIE